MSDDRTTPRSPIEALESVDGVEKRSDETSEEFVTRIGDETDVDAAVLDAAVAYITEGHTADASPESRASFERFLDSLQNSNTSDGQSETPTEHPDDSTLEHSEEDTAQSGAESISGAGTETEIKAESESDDTGARGDGDTEQVDWMPVPKAESEAATPQSTERTARERERTGAATARTADDTAGDASDDPGPIGVRSLSALDERADIEFKSGLRGSEPRKLLLAFVGITVTAPLLGRAMARAWIPGSPLYDQGLSLLSFTLGLAPEPAIEFAGMLGLGVYAALVLLFTLDVTKRVQGVLLAIGSTLALGLLWSQRVFLPAIDPRVPNGVALVVGVLAGLAIEADRLWRLDLAESTLRRPALGDGRIVEFRAAALTLFVLLTVAVAVTLVAANVAGVLQALDVVASLAFVGMLFQFVRYESETGYVALGPERSGKSMLTLGLCQALLDRSSHAPRPTDYLREAFERTSNLDATDDRWPIPSTPRDGIRIGSFEVIAGSLFPRRLEVRTMDYAGQHLSRIAELFAQDEETVDGESVPQTVARGIRDAGTLLFVLDIERLVYPEAFQSDGVDADETLSWGLDHYGTIVENAEPEDAVVVATKCDILVDQGAVDPPSVYESFAAFRSAVTDHLTTRPDVERLLDLTGQSTVHPVGYATRKQDGQYLPYLDDGSLVPIGHGPLINELRRRQ